MALTACEMVIDPNLENAETGLVVDAWINNKPGPQEIILTWSQPYLENALPPGVTGAVVNVTDDQGLVYTFLPDNSEAGKYIWTPSVPGQGFSIGRTYTLSIQKNGENFSAVSELRRTSPIDSITFTYEEEAQFSPAFYLAEFWSRDQIGAGDTYWVRTYKNGNLLNKPNEISTAYDAGFSEGAGFDGIIFIPPVRSSINSFDTDGNGQLLPPYELGDSVYVELYSVTKAAFNFLNEVRIQTDRPGGFAELFATPLSNVSTNLKNTNPNGTKVIGFFCASAVEGLGRKVEE